MRQILHGFRNAFRRCDKVLLLLCLVATAFGCLMISSTTNAVGFTRYLTVQVIAAALGVLAYVVISSIDVDIFSEHRRTLVLFNCVVLLMLIPFGVRINGNRSWLSFPFLPFNIQVAEICKITYILIMASVMSSHQNRVSHPLSVFHMGAHLAVLVGLNYVLSDDAGVSLIFVFIFIGMAFAGGVSLFWFLLGGGSLVAAWPIVWNYMMDDYQRKRILVLFDPSLDPYGINERYHTVLSLQSLTGGGLTGQGLFQGTRTQSRGTLYAQHTDYIFSAIGEELGFLGCALVLVLLGLIVARCIWVGVHSQDYMRRMVCFGAAAALIFQIVSNVGMCMGLTPVVGLTLPFISYGGSSVVTIFAMLGLVSGVHARPAPVSHERYIRPYR